MEWFQAVKEFRLQKKAVEPDAYTTIAAAARAGVSQAFWSRVESGKPRKKDGSPPEPTRNIVRMIAAGLNEPEAVIYQITGFTVSEEDTADVLFARRLRPLLQGLRQEKRAEIEENTLTVIKMLVKSAA